MDVEIDRRRPDALPVLRRRGDARGKRGFRLSAARRAAIDRGLMLRDFDQPVRQIEHLPPLHVPLHRNRQPRQTKPARLRLVPHDPIGLGDLPKRVALVSRLPAAFLVRAPAEAAGDARLLLQPIARRRLGTRRTVQVQSAPEVGVLRLQCLVVGSQPFILGPKRRIVREMGGPQRLVRPPQPRDFAAQLPDVAYERGDRVAIVAGVIPTFDSHFCSACLDQSSPGPKFTPTVADRTHSAWELLIGSD